VSGNYPQFGNFIQYSVYAYYPEDERYRRSLGKLLPHRIGRILDKVGFTTKVSFGQSNGADIKAWIANKLVLVIETKNYNVRTKITDELLENTVENLQAHPYSKKYFIYTQMANEEVLDYLRENGINVLKLGYQLLPRWYYYSILPSNRCYRMIDSSLTSKEIKQKLYPMIHSVLVDNKDIAELIIRL
jgi:hypothetical protein